MNNDFNPLRSTPRNWWSRLASLLALMALIGSAGAQTFHIDATNGGDFELGATFGENNWNMSSGANNPWVIGTLPTGAPFAGNSAYASQTNNPADWSYNIANPCVNYIWRDVTVPAGESVITLTFNWQGQGENTGWDALQVFTAPTSVIPVGQATHPGSGAAVVPPSIAGATHIFQTTQVLPLGVVNTATLSLPPSLAGTTFRLIISWKSDTSLGTQPPVAIDNVVLTSAVPSLYTASALGGLWNSPASWVGGVVPPGGNDILIPAGSTIVVNQSLSYGNITVAGKMQWITTTTPSATVNTLTCTNLTIDPTGEFRAHGPTGAGTATTGGATINIFGNFTNNGYASLASGGTVLWFLATSGTQTLDGTGTWEADSQGRGMIPNLLFANLANNTVSTTQDLVTNNLGATAGTLTTNNKLHIDNAACSNGALINRSIATVTVNAHGTLYNSATPPTVAFTVAPAGGTTATGVANIDDVTGTLRSITITNPGNGYRTAPTVTISGGTGSGATAVAHLYSSFMYGTVAQSQKSGAAIISGGVNIPSNQGVYVGVTAGGTGYTSAPNIGVALPINFLNLMENVGSAGGSGYTSAPTVTFSGGGALTQATGTAVVTRGQVTSVNITAGGTGYLSAPTITLTGGGGVGAVCVFNPAHLPTFSSTIDPTTGMLVSVATTNPGFGYLAAPTVSLNPATGAGGATANATLVSRASLYNMINNWFTPAPTNVAHTESSFVPTNRRVNAFSLVNAVGIGYTFSGDITLYGATPFTTFGGPIFMGGNTLAFDHPTYTGAAGSATLYVDGSISYRMFGSTAAQTRLFPFNSYDAIGAVNNLLSMGSATTVATEGSTITRVKGTFVSLPVGPTPGAVGSRALRIEKFGGLFGNNPTLRLCYNSVDALTGLSDQPNLFVGSSATNTVGSYTARSVASGAGPLAASGNRTTATTAPGPIVDGEEYYAWFSTITPCNSQPVPGNTLSTTTNACPSVNFTLSLQNVINGGSITYQWQSADDAAFTVNLTNLGTATTQVTNQTSAKYYRCLVTCTATTESDYSTPILVNMGGPCQCNAYCAVTNFGDGACITNVAINTLSSTTAACVPNPGYTLRGETTTLQRGLTYPITVTVNNLVYGGGIVSVWFDWNNNFVFEASEWFQPFTTGTTGSINVPVPLTATIGTIRMRVRSRGQGNVNGAGDGCTASFGSGTCEDFCLTIEDPPACDAPPAANTTLSSASNVCSSANFTLSLQNSYPFSGITYQWESADDAAFTVNVTQLGTSNTQVTNQTSSKYYRCVVTCTNPGGGSTPSAPVLVNLITDNCVCAVYPAFYATSAADTEMDSVYVGTLVQGVSTCATAAPGTGSIAARYSNWTGSIAAVNLYQGEVVPFRLRSGTCGGSFTNAFQIFIDYNQDGDWLDAGEMTYETPAEVAQPHIATGTFTVPGTAPLGITRMRVVNVEDWVSGTNFAQTNYTWGESEDFCVNITVPPAPPAAIASIIDNCDVTSTFTVDVNVSSFGSAGSANIIYQVNAGPDVIVPASIGSNIIPTSGSFSQPGDVITVQVNNGTISELDMGAFYGGCPVTITCGTTTTVNHCYGNNDPRVFIFISDNPLEDLTMTFISGTMDPNDVIRTYEGTDENFSPSIVSGSFADLGSPQLTITSSTDTLMLVIDSDGSNSCQDAQQTSWQFEVECLPPCADPDGTATLDVCTNEITVNVDFQGSGDAATIRYILNPGTPGADTTDVPGFTNGTSDVVGPFTPGEQVQVLLINEDDPECTRNLGTQTINAIPAPPTVIASATPTIVCPGGTSQLQATAVAPTPPAVPGYVWEQFVGSYTPITGGVVYGSTTSDDQRFVDPAVPLGGTITTGVGLPIGFSFTFNGVVYDRLAINNNGWISFGSSSLTPAVNNASTSAYTPLQSTTVTTPTHLRNRVAGFGSDIQAQAGASLRLETIGSAPNRVCVIQWANYKDFGVTGHTLNFQIRLYEGTNFVEVHYGPMVWTAGANTAHVGLGGNVATQFNNRTTTTDWNSTTAGAVNSASCSWATAAAYPTVGRVFRWRSPEIAGASYSWTAPTNLDNAFISNPIATVPITETFTVNATGTSFPCPGSTQVTVTVNPPITAASITPAAPDFCTGSNVLLTAVPADGVAPYTYQWYDPSNNPMGTGVTQAANIAGTWSCLITDNCGGTNTPTVNVTSTETPVVSVTPDQPTCAGYDIVLTANTVSGTPTSWLWTGPAPVGGQTTQSVTLNDITTANNGIYSVVATFSGCPSTPAAYTLTANPSPTINSLTAEPITVCPGDDSNLSVTASLPAPATYCIPSMSTGCTFPDIVENVTFAGINRTSACDAPTAPLGYSNFSTPQGNVVAGSTYPISVTTNGDDENLSVWIDYNRDGVFAATERVLERLAVTPEPQTTAGNVTIPLTAFNGPTRMRVRCIYGTTYAQVDPCVSVTFGEVEDYVINITGGVDQIVYQWTGGSFLGGIDNVPNVTATSIGATTTYNILVSSLGCTDTDNVTVYYGTNELTLEVQTDANGDDISYEFREEGTNTLMYYVGPNTQPNNAIVTNDNCLPNGCFYLVVMDAGGDGIVGGGYVLREGAGAQRRIIDNRRDQFGNGGFTTGSVSTIAGGEGFCLPLSNDRLIYTSCDKRDWRITPCTGEYMVANDNPAVSAEYGGPNAATSGYQMWWYAPNGGYSFKRFQSHNTANGLPASATRACHFKLNAWGGNALTEGAFYNVKVRGRIAGNNNNWGTACRMVVNSTEAQCPRTKLMDIPDNPYLSCGQTRAIGTNVYVHARNVKRMNANCTYTNANRYQFRFRIPAEFVTIVKTSATGQYWVNTNGLTCGKTYEVDVRASFDNGATWCTASDPYGDVCLLTTTCTFGMAEEAAGGPMESRIAMYPNPNRGDQVMLGINSVEEGVETVSVDIYDSYGKRAITRVIPVQDGYVNTLIDLNGELANGLYMVSITAGSQAYQERLVIQK